MQQVDRQQGDGHRELAANEEEPHHQHSGDLRQHQLSGLPLGETAQGGDQQPEGKGVHNGARQIEADDLLRALLGGRKRMARTKATMPRGTLIKNSHCHEARERIAAAIVGPAAEETATTKELMPMPRPRKRCG